MNRGEINYTKVKKDERYKKYLMRRFTDAFLKKLNDDYSRLETNYNECLKLINPRVEGDGENIFVMDPPNIEGPNKVANELFDIGGELAKVRA